MVGILRRMRRLKEVCLQPLQECSRKMLTLGYSGYASLHCPEARSNKMQLLDIRLGPGAMIMKPEVKRIHMHFARRINDGHMGPRYACSSPALTITTNFRSSQ